MKKIYKFKKWLTLEETAKRLSIETREEITKADILQLALDEQLKMSVYFPHIWEGKPCFMTEDKNEGEKYEIVERLEGEEVRLYEYEKANNGKYIKIHPEVLIFKAGVYELTLIGNEKNDLDRLLRTELKLPMTDIINLNGFYVQTQTGRVIERQSSIEQDDSIIYIEMDSKDKIRKYDKFYFPCSTIDEIEGAVFVVQTEHLNEFINSLDNENSNDLTIDRSLYLLGEVLNAVKSKARQWTQSTIIDEILLQRQNKNKTAQGLEKRKIEEYFSKANKKLKSE
ncbi:hypothetical protein ACWIW6_02770 [Ursidibacter sp. B-7004-1]